ncbi:hypothetical protein GBA52_013834 [Prunus armeniaca]|nr:hypothetical protein GBA52_013834 [Prunus armeniaca]
MFAFTATPRSYLKTNTTTTGSHLEFTTKIDAFRRTSTRSDKAAEKQHARREGVVVPTPLGKHTLPAA